MNNTTTSLTGMLVGVGLVTVPAYFLLGQLRKGGNNEMLQMGVVLAWVAGSIYAAKQVSAKLAKKL